MQKCVTVMWHVGLVVPALFWKTVNTFLKTVDILGGETDL